MRLPDRVLFIGAHCDDIELCAGGLLARACFEGKASVGVLVFSDHRGIVDDETARRARAEMRENLAWLAAESGTEITDHTSTLLHACSGRFEAERGAIYAAMEALRERYDLVVTHSPTDTNQDHRQVAEEAARVFKAHASLWCGEFPNNDVGGFVPSIYVALEEREIAAKERMIARYRSQDFGGRPYLDATLHRALARVRGSQIREPWAEAFGTLGRTVVRRDGAAGG
jgi:LmbE family N-acetylglucosaminyl deacetylase